MSHVVFPPPVVLPSSVVVTALSLPVSFIQLPIAVVLVIPAREENPLPVSQIPFGERADVLHRPIFRRIRPVFPKPVQKRALERRLFFAVFHVHHYPFTFGNIVEPFAFVDIARARSPLVLPPPPSMIVLPLAFKHVPVGIRALPVSTSFIVHPVPGIGHPARKRNRPESVSFILRPVPVVHVAVGTLMYPFPVSNLIDGFAFIHVSVGILQLVLWNILRRFIRRLPLWR